MLDCEKKKTLGQYVTRAARRRWAQQRRAVRSDAHVDVHPAVRARLVPDLEPPVDGKRPKNAFENMY